MTAFSDALGVPDDDGIDPEEIQQGKVYKRRWERFFNRVARRDDTQTTLRRFHLYDRLHELTFTWPVLNLDYLVRTIEAGQPVQPPVAQPAPQGTPAQTPPAPSQQDPNSPAIKAILDTVMQNLNVQLDPSKPLEPQYSWIQQQLVQFLAQSKTKVTEADQKKTAAETKERESAGKLESKEKELEELKDKKILPKLQLLAKMRPSGMVGKVVGSGFSKKDAEQHDKAIHEMFKDIGHEDEFDKIVNPS